jgi:hypothetical protein
MEGINFSWLAVWVLGPDSLSRKSDFCPALRWSRRAWEGSASSAPTLHPIFWHLPYNWGKSRKTSIRVTEKHSTDQGRTRFVWSTWPSRAMASTGLLAPTALGSRVRRRGQPSVSVRICRVAVLGGFPHPLTLSQTSQSGLWCGRQTAGHPDSRASACYLRTRGHQ